MLSYKTAGESHGRSLLGILDGMPSGCEIDFSEIREALKRRKTGAGRSERAGLEKDIFTILSGIEGNITTGNPIAVELENIKRDTAKEKPTVVRPGHADLIGSLKYSKNSTRDAIERASARETAMRVLLSQIAISLLKPFNIHAESFVKRLGSVSSPIDYYSGISDANFSFSRSSILGAVDKNTERLFSAEIDNTVKNKNSVGGIVQIVAKNIPKGLGSFVSYEKKLDARIAYSLISVQSVKGVSFGWNLFCDNLGGFEYQDSPYYDEGKLKHRSNFQGGFEAGMTNGEDIVIDISLKPVPTLLRPKPSLDILTHNEAVSYYERSDITQVPSALVILESVVLYEIAKVISEEIGGDTMEEMIFRLKEHNKRFDI